MPKVWEWLRLAEDGTAWHTEALLDEVWSAPLPEAPAAILANMPDLRRIADLVIVAKKREGEQPLFVVAVLGLTEVWEIRTGHFDSSSR